MMRRCGILLHPTCFPSPQGIGDLGESAYRFIDFLQAAGQSLWQILPLGPPGYGNSPYQCTSSFAGNPMLINLQSLVEAGWLSDSDLQTATRFRRDYVDFESVIPCREGLLKKAAASFRRKANKIERTAFEAFCADKRAWLDSYAKFMARKEANENVEWVRWRPEVQGSDDDVCTHKFIQFQFFTQWQKLKRYCHQRGIKIIGDIPIFVAHDSADVWSNPELFDLGSDGLPNRVAGVPPDYFSATGQLWGNPLYRWDVHEQTGYRWWIERVRSTLELVDIVRVDHFRGFEKYYEIPAGASDAATGRWVEGPGARLFEALQKALGHLPIIAEDLGLITPEVKALRDRFGFPGMRILQFAFANDSSTDDFKPYNYIRNCVAYTGSHDNDTVAGWFTGSGTGDSTRTLDEVQQEREFARLYLNSDGREIHWDFIRTLLGSVAETAIIPLQDILGLGSEARMNLPASVGRNWAWRYQEGDLKAEISERLRLMVAAYGRVPHGGSVGDGGMEGWRD
ncbi:MAG TPA: 4-alpha-glucanotransferase [Acidobacteriota bacterium]|jgi:4-alpha-glucanotransferase